MLTHLLSLLPSGRRLHRILGTALGAALVLGSSTVQAQNTIYGLGTVSQAIPASNPFLPGAAIGDQAIVPITVATSMMGAAVPITGVAAGQRLVGMDYRPNTGELFALGYNASTSEARLYRLNPTTGVSTPVGTGTISLALGGASERIGFDFNPTVDRIRVVSTNDANFRLNPNTGGIAATDGELEYRISTDANFGKDPLVGAVAYTNSYIGSTSTTLYDIDMPATTGPGVLATQIPPNAGTLNTVGSLTLEGGAIEPEAILSVDIHFNGSTNLAYLMEVTKPGAAGTSASNLYSLNLNTGAATIRRPIINPAVAPFTTGAPFDIRDIAIPIPAPSTPNLIGQLVYAVAGGNLITFDTNVPNNIRSAVNFGGGLAAGQTVVGIDFRPATGQLYALGYDASLSSNNARLYTVDLATGNLTALGAGPITVALGTTADRVGFDFNPAVDRIRLVSTNRANYRLNPNDGSVAAIDTNLDRADMSAAAYTNNQTTNNSGATTLFYYSTVTSTLYRSLLPNSGQIDAVAPSGLANSADGADLDIYNQPGTVNNTAFLAVSPTGGNDRLYNLNLDNGSVFEIGQIGQGSNLSGIAVFIRTANVLTWNGSVSTDWATAANWTPNAVPMNFNDTVIPGGTPNQPTVTGLQVTRALTLNTGAEVNIVGTLVVRGDFTNNSSSSATACSGITGPGIFETTGTDVQAFRGSAMTCFTNLTVGGATVNLFNNASIQRALVLTGSLRKATDATLTLLSNSTGTAYVVNGQGGLAVVTGIGTPVAPVVVQRYITPTNPGLGYRHYSAPVANTTVADLTVPGVFTPVVNAAYNTVGNTVTPFPNVFGYDEARVNPTVVSGAPSSSPEFDKGFFSPTSTADPMEATRGYTVNLPAQANVDFVGNLNNGTISATNLTRGSQAQSGWHLRGNPYPSPLDWNQVSKNGLEDGLYVFKSSGRYTGSYASFVNGVSTNGGTNVLPVAQGFFVRTAAGQTGSLTFTNTARLTSETAPFQRGTADTRPQLALSLAGAGARTQAVAYFEQGATPGFDAAFDAHALPSPNGLTLALETPAAEPLAISGLPLLTGAEQVLPLRLSGRTAGTYAVAVDRLDNLPAGYHVYLRDALTSTYTDLATNPSLNLELAANAPAGGRYALVFTTQARGGVLAAAPAALARLASVYPNPARGSATLLLPAALRAGQATAVTVVDNLGRVVLARTLAAGATETLELPLASLAPGVYAVLARTAQGLVAQRLVVE